MNESSTLDILPIDQGGAHNAFPFGTTSVGYGFYVYTPSAYSAKGPQYPLLLFLHGAGERGNSKIDAGNLKILFRNGPPMLIEEKRWNPKYPMIVVSPQAHDGGWNTARIQHLIKYLIDNYKINKSRIYLTGLSMGGYGTFNYLTNIGNASYVAAAVPICGGGYPGKAIHMKQVPIWAFHGDEDRIVNISNSIDMINAINATNLPLKAKLTIYPGVGHNCWTKTYDGSGMGTESTDYDPFNMSIYDWMFQFQLNQLKN